MSWTSVLIYLSFILVSTVLLTVAVRPLLNLTKYIFVYHNGEGVLEKAFLLTGYCLTFVIIAAGIILVYSSIVSLFDASVTFSELIGIAFFFVVLTVLSRISALGYLESKDNPKTKIMLWKKRVIRSTYYSFLMTLLFLGLLGNAGTFIGSSPEINIPVEASLDGTSIVLIASLIVGVSLVTLVAEGLLGSEWSPLYVPEHLRD